MLRLFSHHTRSKSRVARKCLPKAFAGRIDLLQMTWIFRFLRILLGFLPMDDDLEQLYQDIILGHNKRPKHEGELDPHTAKAEGFNPLCGDRITVFVNEEDGKITRAKFLGEGCAISRASASIMTTLLAGLTPEQAREKAAEVYQLLTAAGEPVVDLAEMGDLAALAGVRKFPARIKCATLAWHALEEALGDPRTG